MKFRSILFVFLFVLGAHAEPVSAESSVWRSLLSLPPPGSEGDRTLAPLDRFVLGVQTGSGEAVAAALADTTWSRHLRVWSRARWEYARGRAREAAESYAEAAQSWPATLEEPALVLAAFDRERLALALEEAELERARAIVAGPLRAHDDPAWDALRAKLLLRSGEVAEARTLFDAAWRRADRVDQRDLAFAHRALAHLALGDSTAAARSWIEFVEVLRRPERLRAALVVWESAPALADVVRHDARRRVVLDWLVRLFQRDRASALARDWFEAAPAEQRAELFVFIAEQSYRLRQNRELESWLAQPWPEPLRNEERAALEAYPLGVERRAGHSEALARGFDAIAERHAPAARAAEARWEAAWMWELSGEESTAVDRYERYLRERPKGPFASAAALRTVFLRWRAGDFEGAVAAHRRHGASLDDGVDGAAGLWLAADAVERLGRSEEAAQFRERLSAEHPASPFWRDPLEVRPSTGGDVERRVEEFARAHARAWAVLEEHFGVELLRADDRDELHGIDRLAELGLTTEAEIRLAAWAEARRSDTLAVARACALAHRRGLPEMLGRQGWILERRLADQDTGAGHAALVVSLPTPFAWTVVELGEELQIAPELVWALMRRESFYDADVMSIAGAYGLLQLIPRTAAEMAARLELPSPEPEDLFVPALNLRLGIGYLAGLFEESEGDRIRALASYNAGESNGLRWQRRRREGDPDPLGILVISFSETRAYVYHVLRLWNHYADAYGPAAP